MFYSFAVMAVQDLQRRLCELFRMQIWKTNRLSVVGDKCRRKCDLFNVSCKAKKGPNKGQGSKGGSEALDPGGV